MLKDRLIDKAIGSAGLPITADRSRCMRMRFDRNKCPVCISNCHSGAITIDDDIVINADKCTLCMVCVSECPADCFDIKGGDFFSVLARLRKMQDLTPRPMLGCKMAEETEAHEKIPCLGSLSEEHLIAIRAFLDKPLQLNLTSCAGCHNSFVLDLLKARIADIRDSAGIDVSEKVILVDNKADLRFEDILYDRRGFFSAVKNMAFIGASGFLEKDPGHAVQSYSQKKMTIKKNILNAVIRNAADIKSSAGILREFAFTAQADAACDSCYACVGICPTGALRSRRDDTGRALLFNSSLCNGCSLCRDVCFNDAIAIQQGYSGGNYFGYETCNTDSCRTDATDVVCCPGQ